MYKVLLLIVVMLSVTVHGAIPKKASSSTILALKLPITNRLQVLKDKGLQKTYTELELLVKDQKQPLEVRWRALTAAGMLYPKSAQALIAQSINSKQWFIRNAAIIAAGYGERDQSIQWAERLLFDKALVVRTSAVQTLHKLGAIESEQKLWSALSDKKNFYKGKSLWIRKHVLRTLSVFASKTQAEKFARLLQDTDQRLHPYAIKALEKIHGQKKAIGESLVSVRKAWMKEYSIQ